MNFNEYIRKVIEENHGVYCENIDEVKTVGKILVDCGYEVYDYYDLERDWKKFPFFLWSNKKCYFVQGRFCPMKISASIFIKDFNEFNKKRKLRPDIDPYGEENWGWEEINGE